MNKWLHLSYWQPELLLSISIYMQRGQNFRSEKPEVLPCNGDSQLKNRFIDYTSLCNTQLGTAYNNNNTYFCRHYIWHAILQYLLNWDTIFFQYLQCMFYALFTSLHKIIYSVSRMRMKFQVLPNERSFEVYINFFFSNTHLSSWS